MAAGYDAMLLPSVVFTWTIFLSLEHTFDTMRRGDFLPLPWSPLLVLSAPSFDVLPRYWIRTKIATAAQNMSSTYIHASSAAVYSK